MNRTQTKSDARERIVETAERLFYAEGVRGVGIDRIIAEAGVAKMTLYNHFASKDDLILAVLKFRESKVVGFFESAIARYVDAGLDPLEAFFATLKEWFESRDFRGCAFINACVELADASHPASRFARKHKESFREMLARIVTESVGAKGARLVPAISLLVEGAIVTAVIEGASDCADAAREAALALVGKTRSTKTSAKRK